MRQHLCCAMLCCAVQCGVLLGFGLALLCAFVLCAICPSAQRVLCPSPGCVCCVCAVPCSPLSPGHSTPYSTCTCNSTQCCRVCCSLLRGRMHSTSTNNQLASAAYGVCRVSFFPPGRLAPRISLLSCISHHTLHTHMHKHTACTAQTHTVAVCCSLPPGRLAPHSPLVSCSDYRGCATPLVLH
jgi:hypothetical protein